MSCPSIPGYLRNLGHNETQTALSISYTILGIEKVPIEREHVCVVCGVIHAVLMTARSYPLYPRYQYQNSTGTQVMGRLAICDYTISRQSQVFPFSFSCGGQDSMTYVVAKN